MNRTIRRWLAVSFRCTLAMCILATAGALSASTLTINSSQSYLNFDLDLISLEELTVIGPLIGQGEVPQGALPFGNGTRIPGYSNGLSAQPTGTLDVTPGGFRINATSNVGLLNSGSWQPGTPIGNSFGAAPIPGELGAYLVGTLIGPDPDLFIIGRVYDTLFKMATSNLALGPNGVFDDPLGVLTLADGYIDLSAVNPLSGLWNSSNAISVGGPVSGVFDLSGTYLHGQLSLWLNGSVIIDLSALFEGLPIGLNMAVNGHILTERVPEPGSCALFVAGSGAMLAAMKLRRRRRG